VFEAFLLTCLSEAPIYCAEVTGDQLRYKTEAICREQLELLLRKAVDVMYSSNLVEIIHIESWDCRRIE